MGWCQLRGRGGTNPRAGFVVCLGLAHRKVATCRPRQAHHATAVRIHLLPPRASASASAPASRLRLRCASASASSRRAPLSPPQRPPRASDSTTPAAVPCLLPAEGEGHFLCRVPGQVHTTKLPTCHALRPWTLTSINHAPRCRTCGRLCRVPYHGASSWAHGKELQCCVPWFYAVHYSLHTI